MPFATTDDGVRLHYEESGSGVPIIFVHEFAGDPMWQWVLGAVLLLWGSVIIAFHQYWRSVAAVMVSLLGWFLAIRGVLILAVPTFTTGPATPWSRTLSRWCAPSLPDWHWSVCT